MSDEAGTGYEDDPNWSFTQEPEDVGDEKPTPLGQPREEPGKDLSLEQIREIMGRET